jgi:hypothetical protein
MNAITATSTATAAARSVPSQRKPSGDGAIYLALAVLTLGAWLTSRMGWFKAGDDVGYWIGVAGGSMLLLLFLYPLRKHVKVLQTFGRVKFWLWFHMMLGIAGPLLILIHSTFRIGSLNAGVALYSMIIVALSGVIGRFIYRRVHGGLDGQRVGLRELQVRAGFDQSESRSKLQFAPAVEDRLQAFEQRELQAAQGWFTHLRQVVWLPCQMWATYWICAFQLRRPLRKIAERKGWEPHTLRTRQRLARKLVRRYLSAVVRVAQYTAYERVFALWHVIHIPFVYLLILSAVAHVVAVHVY